MIQYYHWYAFTFKTADHTITHYDGLTQKFGGEGLVHRLGSQPALLTRANIAEIKLRAKIGVEAALLNVIYLGYGTAVDFFGEEGKE